MNESQIMPADTNHAGVKVIIRSNVLIYGESEKRENFNFLLQLETGRKKGKNFSCSISIVWTVFYGS